MAKPLQYHNNDLIPISVAQLTNLNQTPPTNKHMKIKQFLGLLTVFSISLFPSLIHATNITATNSGNWSDITIWNSGTVPGATDDVDVPFGINVTVDTNASIGYVYDYGTLIMGNQFLTPMSSMIVRLPQP